jgi:hypothetical protein
MKAIPLFSLVTVVLFIAACHSKKDTTTHGALAEHPEAQNQIIAFDGL